MNDKFKSDSQKNYKKIIESNRNCMIPGCSNVSIKSHFFSKGIILKNWSSNSKLFTLETNLSGFERHTKFKDRGIDEYPWLKFYGYCKDHDNEIFKQIEDKNEIDFFDSKNQILVSIRGVLKEYRKKENVINLLEKECELSSLGNLQKIKLFVLRKEFELGLNDLKDYHDKLLLQLDKPSDLLTFKTFKIEKLPIGFSTMLNFESFLTFKTEVLQSIIFTCFPYLDSTYLVVGYKSGNDKIRNYINQIDSYIKTKKVTNFLSNLLIKNIEDWIIEVNHYSNFIKPIENEIINKINYYNSNLKETILDANKNLDNNIMNLFIK